MLTCLSARNILDDVQHKVVPRKIRKYFKWEIFCILFFCNCTQNLFLRILLSLSNKCTMYANKMFFFKHCYMFRYLFIILRVASRHLCLLHIYKPEVCTVHIVQFYYSCPTNLIYIYIYIYIDSIFLETLLHISVFIHHSHQDHS